MCSCVSSTYIFRLSLYAWPRRWTNFYLCATSVEISRDISNRGTFAVENLGASLSLARIVRVSRVLKFLKDRFVVSAERQTRARNIYQVVRDYTEGYLDGNERYYHGILKSFERLWRFSETVCVTFETIIRGERSAIVYRLRGKSFTDLSLPAPVEIFEDTFVPLHASRLILENDYWKRRIGSTAFYTYA